MQPQPPRHGPGDQSQYRYDRPGRHHRSGDPDRAEMEQDCAGERRGTHHAVRRATRSASMRANKKPRKDDSNGDAPSLAARLKNAIATAIRPRVSAIIVKPLRPLV